MTPQVANPVICILRAMLFLSAEREENHVDNPTGNSRCVCAAYYFTHERHSSQEV